MILGLSLSLLTSSIILFSHARIGASGGLCIQTISIYISSLYPLYSRYLNRQADVIIYDFIDLIFYDRRSILTFTFLQHSSCDYVGLWRPNNQPI